MPGLTYVELKALDPCEKQIKAVIKVLGGPREWNGRTITAQDARNAGVTFNNIIWAAMSKARTEPEIKQRVQLWMADCAAHVLHIYERIEKSDAPRNAVLATRNFARGEIDAAAWDAARDAARSAATATATATATDAATATAADWAGAAATDAARAAAWSTAWASDAAADADAAWSAARAAARAAERQWQLDRLCLWLSDNEPKEWPLPNRDDA